MTKLYAIQASIEFVKTGKKGSNPWVTCRHMPTFYLNPNVQGIVSTEHAEHIARSMFEGMPCASAVYVHATLVDTGEDFC